MHPTTFCLALALAGFSPLAAAADCLGSADLDTGVEVLFSNSDRTTIRRLPDGGLAWEEFYAAAGFSARFQGRDGIYPDSGHWSVIDGQPDETTVFQRRYAEPTADLPALAAAGGTLSTSFAEVTGDPATRDWTTSDLAVAWGPAASLVLPDCTYAVIGVEFVIDWQDGSGGGSTAWSMFLPELGAGFIIAAQNHGGNLIAAAPVAIRRLDDI
jgi:hypothetical protein